MPWSLAGEGMNSERQKDTTVVPVSKIRGRLPQKAGPLSGK